MLRLPIYEKAPTCAIESSSSLPVDTSCRRCELGGKGRETCLSADGEAGGVLVVIDAPGKDEEAARRPLAGRTGLYLRQQLKRFWSGPIALDHAVRCVPIPSEGPAPYVEPCRPYLAQTLREVQPQRVLCFGPHSAAAVLGRSVSTMDTLRGYAWLGLGTNKPVPVYLLPSPLFAVKNRLIKTLWFEPALKWALTEQPPVGPDAWKATYNVVRTFSDAQSALKEAESADASSVDLEWAGHPFNKDHRILSVSVTTVNGGQLGDTFVFGADALRLPEVVALLKLWWANPQARKFGSNLKADVVAFNSVYGVMLEGQVSDTRFLRRLLESDASAKLEVMAELVGLGGHKHEMEDAAKAAVAFVRKEGKKLSAKAIASELEHRWGYTGVLPEHVQKVLDGDDPKTYRMAFVQPRLLQRYNARDTITTALVNTELMRRLGGDEPDLARVYSELVLPVASCLGHVESWGMPVSREGLSAFGAYLQAEMDILSSRFKQYGPEFNPNSSAHITKLLFTDLGIVPKHFTDSGKPATHAEALEEYAKLNPVAYDVLRWRRLTKLKGTYADGDDGEGGLLTHVRDDGRIHPSINPDGTRTGRASSSGPNLQNIPRADTPEGKLLRDCFVAPPGWVFVELDHSQLELRIAADQSGDEKMLAIFHSKEDYHLRTAKMIAPQVWPKLDPETITKDGTERTTAKTVNFAVLYDDSPYGLAFRLGVPKQKAMLIRDALFGAFKKLGTYIEDRVKETAKSGTARTWWNGGPARRRWLVAVADVNEDAAKTARRGSWNTPVQGTGSDYLAAGMVEVVRWIREEGIAAQVCVPIHDAIMALVREDVLDEYLYVVPRLMTAFKTRHGVPLVVDAKVGKSWGSMEKKKL